VPGPQLQIAYFPYLFFSRIRSLSFFHITISNSKDALSQLEDEVLRDKIKSLIAQNRILGKESTDIGIVAIRGKYAFSPLGKAERESLNEARAALFLSAMARCNTVDSPNAGHFMLTSDNFKIVYQNFTKETLYIGYSSGVIVQQNDFGYPISQLVYEKPFCVLKHGFEYDRQLLQALKLLRREDRRLYRLIARATDSFMNAYTNSEDVSYESRILEGCRAFEILLGLPERDQRKAFKDAIKKYCEPAGERSRRYLSERSGNKREYEKGSRQVMWADRFYTLRNHIIHGDRVPTRLLLFHKQRHFDLALWFFLVIVKHMMNKALKKDLFYDSIRCEKGKFGYDSGGWSKATAEALRALKKRTPKAGAGP
jgi:hypothetical protein